MKPTKFDPTLNFSDAVRHNCFNPTTKHFIALKFLITILDTAAAEYRTHNLRTHLHVQR